MLGQILEDRIMVVDTRGYLDSSRGIETICAGILLVAQHISSHQNALDLSAGLAEKFDNINCLHQIQSRVLWLYRTNPLRHTFIPILR